VERGAELAAAWFCICANRGVEFVCRLAIPQCFFAVRLFRVRFDLISVFVALFICLLAAEDSGFPIRFEQ
jgi:hypothetical protein